jgi:hypothetical protein
MSYSPEFNAVWDVIKKWDIQRTPESGYSHATGDEVVAILDALKSVESPPESDFIENMVSSISQTAAYLLDPGLSSLNTVQAAAAILDYFDAIGVSENKNLLEAREYVMQRILKSYEGSEIRTAIYPQNLFDPNP